MSLFRVLKCNELGFRVQVLGFQGLTFIRRATPQVESGACVMQ